jgi:hypothetical protein
MVVLDICTFDSWYHIGKLITLTVITLSGFMWWHADPRRLKKDLKKWWSQSFGAIAWESW